MTYSGKYVKIVLLCILCVPQFLFAASTDELKQKIDERSTTIKNLEKEIAQYQKQIDDTGKQAQTLGSAIKVLTTSEKQIQTSITVTTTKIDKATLTIQQLAQEILEKQQKIEVDQRAAGEIIRQLNQTNDESMIEVFLRGDSISTIWDDISTSESIQDSLQKNLIEVSHLKFELEKDYAERTNQKKQLVDLQKELAGKKNAVELTKKEKADLLNQTKSKEASYKKVLADKVALKNAFEKELRDFESQLNYTIDPNSIPHTGSGVLSWPLDQIVITQQFGDTDFSRQNPGAYNGKGHNGLDFKASVGTRVKASLDGLVKAVGDTDTVCPKASYGKWVLLEHGNGLSTLYAHLSVVSVASGQSVRTGDVIGLSGNTGYTTGPHLHFTLYASQGVRVLSRQSQVCGGTYVMPVADLKAYLNPLLYL